jgi:HPt (histidine-containing phosphotransfer) domain-containing protein
VPLLERSVLTDVFRHSSESRAYLIGVFVDESRARLEQLADAAAAGDTATMERLTHALKGSAAAVGARRLERICAEAHDAALAGSLSDARELHGRLEHCVELTADLLRAGCPQLQEAEPVLT